MTFLISWWHNLKNKLIFIFVQAWLTYTWLWDFFVRQEPEISIVNGLATRAEFQEAIGLPTTNFVIAAWLAVRTLISVRLAPNARCLLEAKMLTFCYQTKTLVFLVRAPANGRPGLGLCVCYAFQDLRAEATNFTAIQFVIQTQLAKDISNQLRLPAWELTTYQAAMRYICNLQQVMNSTNIWLNNSIGQ